jgi:tripeptidyl-peptidase-1
MVAPKQESIDLVKEWLARETSGSNAEVTVKGDYVTVQASVNVVEQLLKTKYNTFGKFI